MNYKFPLRNIAIFTQAALLIGASGCNNKPQPGQELYALKNPTRSWKIPEYKATAAEGAARIFIKEKDHDFGLVEPHVPITHDFLLQNEGQAPLSVTCVDSPDSIKVSTNKNFSIAAGKSKKICLTWTPQANARQESQQNVRFRTNDLRHRSLQLTLTGRVASTVSVDPPALVASRVRPDRTTPVTLLVSSQRWDSFDMSELTSSLPDLTWQIEPAPPERLQPIGALSGWLVHATLPAGLLPGKISNKSLSLQIQPHGEEATTRQLEIPIVANVLRRVAVYGDGIDEKGTIHFGVIPAGVDHQRTLIVKVHDELPRLGVTDLEVIPDFLQVRLNPYQPTPNTKNLYRLEVVLPATAPPCVYRAQRLGKIQFYFDHPRVRELALNVDFVLHSVSRQAFSTLSQAQ